MRKSLWLAAITLGLGAASNAMAGGTFSLNPLAPSNGVNFNAFSGPNNGVNYSPFGASTAPPSGASQATFSSPGQTLAGPSRLLDLMPNLHSLTNTHVIGYSVFPTQTDQYLSQFGFQRIR
jgi:hypothetical protein